VTNLITKRRPSVMIELGGYVGYSAILFGEAIKANGGKQFLSIEKNPEMAAVANQLVDLAGLRDIVRIIVGASDEVLQELVHDRKEITQVEMMFIDHWQALYRPDLWLLEELGVLIPGTSAVVADNVIMPGAPEYLEWVQATTEQKRELVKKLDLGLLTPNPNLVYETTVSEFATAFGKVFLGSLILSIQNAELSTGWCGGHQSNWKGKRLMILNLAFFALRLNSITHEYCFENNGIFSCHGKPHFAI